MGRRNVLVIVASAITLAAGQFGRCRKQRCRSLGERWVRVQRYRRRQLLRDPSVHVARAGSGRRERHRKVRLHAGSGQRRAPGERVAALRSHRRHPGLGRWAHRGELPGVARRPRHVVPGAGQRRGSKSFARHVLDDRRGRSRNGRAVLRRPSRGALPVLPRTGQPSGSGRLRETHVGGRAGRPARPPLIAVRAPGSGQE